MFYERKIKYLDYLIQGERHGNAGFVKIEAKGSACSLTIQVKGLRDTDSFVGNVYAQGMGREEKLCEIKLCRGMGTVCLAGQSTGNIGNTGIGYGQMQGIRIMVSPDRELRCVLREGERMSEVVKRKAPGENTIPGEVLESAHDVKLEEVLESAHDVKLGGTDAAGDTQKELTEFVGGEQPVEKASELVTEETDGEGVRLDGGMIKAKRAVPTMQEEETAEKKRTESEISEGTVAADKMSETKMPEGKTTREKISEEKTPEKNIPEPRLPNKELPERKPAEKESGAGEAQETTAEPVKRETEMKVCNNKWEQLAEIYPHITPFRDEREYLSVGLNDFVILPSKYFRLIQNSFLLHGYYNYNHLVLKRLQRMGREQFYIGVPGNFFEREKQVAVMFGFQSFECREEPAADGDYGYYLMPIEL